MGKFIDLTGEKFDMLTVIERAENIGKRTQWVCKCDCGNVVTVKTEYLKGKVKLKSCGCIYGERDLSGMQFGRLTVIQEHGSKRQKRFWLCKCECGNITIVSTDCLKSGHIKSCGCFRKDKLIERNQKHGLSKSRIYHIWLSMKERCYSKNSKSFCDYGARGISICDDWKVFDNFYKWAIANGYDDTLTIERVNVNDSYCPENCTWIPKADQAKNTRRSVIIEIFGIKKTLSDWVRFMGWSYGKYTQRKWKGKEIFSEDEIMQIENKIRSENNAL